MRIIFLLSILSLTSPAFAAAKPTAEELLQDSDRARGATGEGISWNIVLETVEDGQTTKISYAIKAKGHNALAEAIAPSRSKGELILFNDRNLWFYKPGLKKPVAISARQRLIGQAANGDIASTNYYRDYEGRIIGEETVGGVATYKLELKAKAKNVTYDGIRYWISKKDRLGVKAEFLTLGGDVFKTAAFTYDNKLPATSGTKEYAFVSKMVITDALNPSNHTTATYEVPKQDKHAESIFNVNNLMR